MATAVNILLATSAVSLISLVGVFLLSLREALLRQLAVLLVALRRGSNTEFSQQDNSPMQT